MPPPSLVPTYSGRVFAPWCRSLCCCLPQRCTLSPHLSPPPPSALSRPPPLATYQRACLSSPQLGDKLYLRSLVHRVYGAAFPVSPGGCFPASVLDSGALPAVPYDLAFMGFPCVNFSRLNRVVTPSDVQGSLDLLRAALLLLGKNPPRVFVLENTTGLFSQPPAVLESIHLALETLPYSWRYAFSPLSSILPSPILSSLGIPALLIALSPPASLFSLGAPSSALVCTSARPRRDLASGGSGITSPSSRWLVAAPPPRRFPPSPTPLLPALVVPVSPDHCLPSVHHDRWVIWYFPCIP